MRAENEYIKTWMHGHYGEHGLSSEELWKKVGTADLYVYSTNNSVKMIRIGDFLYSIDENDYRLIKQGDVTDRDKDLHTNIRMTEYTSF